MTTDAIIEEKKITARKIKEPSKYKVMLLNDDYTPMEFVVALLIKVFRIGHDAAVKLTMQIHQEGSAVAGVYSYEIAEQKVIESTELARLNGHPLIIKAAQE